MKQEDKQITTLSSLDIAPKDGDLNLGFYLPRMTIAERNAIPLSFLRRGCLIYITDAPDAPTAAEMPNKLQFYKGDGTRNNFADWESLTSVQLTK